MCFTRGRLTDISRFVVTVLLVTFFCSTNAVAETFRCTMDREITVGAFGNVEDNKEKNKGREYYLAIDNNTQKGTYSTCYQGASCSTSAEISTVTRHETEGLQKSTKNLMIRMIVGSKRQLGQLWSLHQQGGEKEFIAIAVSAFGQRSDTDLGTCQKVVE